MCFFDVFCHFYPIFAKNTCIVREEFRTFKFCIFHKNRHFLLNFTKKQLVFTKKHGFLGFLRFCKKAAYMTPSKDKFLINFHQNSFFRKKHDFSRFFAFFWKKTRFLAKNHVFLAKNAIFSKKREKGQKWGGICALGAKKTVKIVIFRFFTFFRVFSCFFTKFHEKNTNFKTEKNRKKRFPINDAL